MFIHLICFLFFSEFSESSIIPEVVTSNESLTDNGDCDFETDYCGYIPNLRFERWKGKAPASQFGPSSGPNADHTTGLGYYALCVGSKLANDETECQLSKTFTNKRADTKFSFWYYLYGTTVGSLELKKNDIVIWSDEKQQNSWKKSVIDFPIGTFTVIRLLLRNQKKLQTNHSN